jgi:sulfide:quinone oxidoreductase
MARDAPHKLLIAGGGPAAIEAVLALRELAPRIAVELIAPEPDFIYRPLSVVEPFARPGMRRYPLARLQDRGVTLRRGTVARVDTARRSAATEQGEDVAYDSLLVAIGARSQPSENAGLSFGGPDETEAVHGLIQDVEGGHVRSLAFVAPVGATWTLPLYELALQTAERARDMCLHDVTITVGTPESRPLEVFGDAAADLLDGLLSERGIRRVNTDATPAADRLITTPLLGGRRIDGLPADPGGFLPVDPFGRVLGSEGVWAAGDDTDFPIKQGGLAAQQAETAARSMAEAAGHAVEVTPFEPVLRGMLIAGRQAWSLRRRLDGNDPGQVSRRALWWPPSKIAGRRLAPFLDQLDAEAGVRGVASIR